MSPVTQTALVDVNNAFKKEIPLCVALGNINKVVPIKIMLRKLMINNCAGLKIVRL